MEQNSKLDYLKKYSKKRNGSIKLISDSDLNYLDILTQEWYKIFKEKSTENRIKLILHRWEQYVGSELRNTISYLKESLDNVELIEVNERISVLYTVKDNSGQVAYYEGRLPQTENINNELKNAWDKLPVSLRSFYENVHNGFYCYASGSMGLVCLEEVSFLGDDNFEWSIIEDLDEPLQINLNTSFGFFSNGMGIYVAIDYNNCENDNATLWSAKDEPEYNLNFWDVVDEWILIGLEMS
ncbi:superoxide dismutase [Paenibacillus jamilae]|uniref:hypothetical protein n=1 Tax=Paenibacillus jamilae TaxID=114136 RepID=UPI0007ABF106|nr:hypothetical protein [Paenibacillus jamilae]KZE70769.1 superoxide dismutase [Paenibacillus jamilae]